MKETDEIDIKIKIANEQLTLRNKISEQGFIRDVEANIEELYSTWRPRFPHLSDNRLLAMMVYQYASFYFSMRQRYNDVMDTSRKVSGTLADAIKDAD